MTKTWFRDYNLHNLVPKHPRCHPLLPTAIVNLTSLPVKQHVITRNVYLAAIASRFDLHLCSASAFFFFFLLWGHQLERAK